MPNRPIAPVRVNPVLIHDQERRLGLGGPWGFRLDPEDKGLDQRWFADLAALGETIEVPGCWQGQGFGGDGTDTLWDFRLPARTYRATYKGTGWYGKHFRIPDEWRGLRVWLNFGGVHPSAEVWLNGARLGASTAAPFVPFGFEVTERLRFGDDNALIVRVHEANRELGLAYNWQGNWSGLYRTVELTATRGALLERLWLRPDADAETLGVLVRIGGPDARSGKSLLRVSAKLLGDEAAAVTGEWPIQTGESCFALPIPAPRLWSPDAPNLYRVDAALVGGGDLLDAQSERVGFVKLSTAGKHLLINGEPYYMRGTGDFLAHPETGSPDTDRDRWRRKLRTLREYGYNYVRCQSYVPAPEYYDVADEVGLLVQSEMGMLGGWGGSGVWHVYAWPAPTPGVREALKWQWDRVVMRDANHPSANLYCMSNELGKGTLFPRTAWQCYHDTKAVKPTALVIWTDGGHNDELPEDFVNAEAETDAECEKPLIQHEFRWWSALPDVRAMGRYTGAVRPYGAEIAKAAAERHGIAHVLPTAAANSQHLQLVEAKGKMEACRRDNARLAGICHFTAMDMNPSPQGIIDEFYERKVADAAAWRRTNGDTVILAGLGFDERVLAGGETLRCGLFVSDFSHPPLEAPTIDWTLLAGKKQIAAGRVEYAHKAYCTCAAGEIAAAVPEIAKPVKATLSARLSEGGRAFANQWDVWLFPRQAELPESLAVYGKCGTTWAKTVKGLPVVSAEQLSAGGTVRAVLTERLDETLVAFVRGGGRVLVAAGEGLVRPFGPKLGLAVGRYFFTPPANYAPFEDGHDGTIIAEHPMLGALPHEGFADLQFFRMMAEAPPLELEPLGLNAADPVIRVMHSYPVGRSLGYLAEGSLGEGGMVLCALNLDQSLPEARCLLAAISKYMVGDEFAPALALGEDAVARMQAGTAMPALANERETE